MNEESLFHRALEMPLCERAPFLDRECSGNAGLRERLEILLQAHENPGSFLRAPVPRLQATAEQPPITERPGSAIGPYELMEQIGEGGFGLVFVAEQQEPVRRKVALKIIKPGMDSGEVIARFEAERQALALMEHPNIARIFDGGTTQSGRPYFVMELVKGIPIIEYCDQQQLTANQRLDLFLVVCQAVQHAHGKGIIHRDLKPSNILVAPHDGVPVVKVIDFGVAKAIGQQLTNKKIYTRFTQMIGTPLYMSPEQAEVNALDVDIRSDVYSLGVLLYELLTGTTPFDKQRFATAAYDEIRRIIKEEEPPKPSTRLSTLGETLSQVSAQRKMEPRKLSAYVRGDLDWIVMKALEKERTRRYETASAMAADVRRYMSEEPIEARPPSALYRFRKMARRNRAVMTTLGMVAATLLLGIIGTTFGLVQAIQSAADALAARDEESRQREAVEDQRNRAILAEAEARKSEELARESEKQAAANAGLAKKQELFAKEQTLLARDQAKIAEKERHRADIERKKAQESEYLAQSQLYASNLASARRELGAKNFPRFSYHLEQCRPDFRGWEHDYLYTLFNQDLQTFRGHTQGVASVAFSPDGKLIASADTNPFIYSKANKGPATRTVKLWDALTGKAVLSRDLASGSSASMAFSPDGKWLAEGLWRTGRKGAVALWRVVSDKNTVDLHEVFSKDQPEWINCVAFSPDSKILAAGVGYPGPGGDTNLSAVRLWESTTGKELPSLHGHTGSVRGVAFSPDGRRLASASQDKTVKLWELASGKEYLMLKGHTNRVYTAIFSPDGKRLATSSSDLTIRLWDAISGRELLTLSGHGRAVQCVAFSPDGRLLASASEDQTVKLWDADSGLEIITLRGHIGTVQCVAFSPDGKRLASTGLDDKTMKLWDVAESPRNLAFKEPGVRAVWFSPNGKLQAVSDPTPFPPRGVDLVRKHIVKQWNLPSTRAVLASKIDDLSSAFAVSADGKHLASATYDAVANGYILKLRDATTGLEQGSVRGLSGTDQGLNSHVRSLAVSRDGKLIADALLGGTVKVWNAANGKLVLTHKEQWPARLPPLAKTMGNPMALAFSPDGKRLAHGAMDEKVTIWDLDSGKKLHSFQGDKDRKAFRLVFSPDGERLACAWTPAPSQPGLPKEAAPSMLTVWDTANGKAWTLHGNWPKSLAFSPDGKRLAGAFIDPMPMGKEASTGDVKFWDAATGQELLTLRVDSPVLHLAFSPDGKRLAGGTADGIIIWDASKSMKELEKK